MTDLTIIRYQPPNDIYRTLKCGTICPVCHKNTADWKPNEPAELNPVTAAGGSSDAPIISAQTLSATSTANDGYHIGFQFTVGASNIIVTEVGRWTTAGDVGQHTLYFETDAANVIVTNSVPVGTAGQFSYATLASPQVLTNGQQYCLFSIEDKTATDHYYSSDTSVTASSAITILRSVYGSAANVPPGVNVQIGLSGSYSYVPLNFKWHYQ